MVTENKRTKGLYALILPSLLVLILGTFALLGTEKVAAIDSIFEFSAYNRTTLTEGERDVVLMLRSGTNTSTANPVTWKSSD